MDALRSHDLELARSTPPGEKAVQALDTMALGLRLKREALERAHPGAAVGEIDRLMLEWMLAGD